MEQKILQEKEFANELLRECPEELKAQTLVSELFGLKEMLPELPNQEEFIPLYLQLQGIEWKDQTSPSKSNPPCRER